MTSLPLLAAALAGAAAAPDPSLFAGALPRGHTVVQLLSDDLDGDEVPEWIAVGEPPAGEPGAVSVAIFARASDGGAPTLLFAQRLAAPQVTRAGATVLEVAPLGKVLVLFAAAPHSGGDSRFVVQLYGREKRRFRPMIPELPEFRSQGGFAIEDVEPGNAGDELVAWTYLKGPDEQLHDLHRYAYKRWRFDGIRFVADARETRTPERLADFQAAARAAGVRGTDLRRRVARVAEIP